MLYFKGTLFWYLAFIYLLHSCCCNEYKPVHNLPLLTHILMSVKSFNLVKSRDNLRILPLYYEALYKIQLLQMP